MINCSVSSLRALFFCTVLSGLLGCAALEPVTGFRQYAPDVMILGQPIENVERLLGKASTRLQTAAGSRLIFTRGPYGRHSYAVDFDAKRQAIGFEQLLTEERFAKVFAGMGAEEVIALIGPSSVRQGLARQWGSLWSYRFDNTRCLWFQIEWDAQMKVRSAGYGIPPECLRPGR
ncbi:MAG: hypothetical protein EBZ03_08120 [Betaproteobacteria bacterium]|nr:hypothetical protein [Pseudomonadota bacterium]NBO12347.1 hypothetical protein [Betaproteobacteria bacterium]NBO44162.1 hypothetical protein [Betaproteobacteria bacterium]NBP10094.1 hypothetical protein [Betaproteobacteria bacterium]NBP61963.1 hypothetical protein [Betaproteobacteria bacterium]